MDYVELKQWMNSDKMPAKMSKKFFMGTAIVDQGTLKGYQIQILFPQMGIPTKIYQTNEEAVKVENEIWAAFKE